MAIQDLRSGLICPLSPGAFWSSERALRRPSQYFFMRSETSSRSFEFIDLRPRRPVALGIIGAAPALRCNSSNEAITRSSFSFSAYNS